MRGVLKGLKYFSQIFDEDQEKEMQIGLPTDVKHVAHIGMDGPSTESPSWMNKYQAPERTQSAPLDPTGEPIVPESSSHKTDKPKASRRRHSADNLTIDLPENEASTKSKSSRRHHKKGSSEGSSVSKSGRRRHHKKDASSSDREGSSSRLNSNDTDSNGCDLSESPLPSPSNKTPRKLPDIPKSTRRKKSKDESSKSSGSKTSANNVATPTSENVSCNNEVCQISSRPNPPFVEEEKGN